MRTLIALVSLILLVPEALACSCGRQSTEQARRHADVVFAGRVEEVVKIDGAGSYEPRIIVRFAVGRVWKGDVPAGFSMYTYQEFSSCRGFFGELAQPGEELLVYASRGTGAAWKGNDAAVGAANAGSYTVMGSRGKPEVLRQDLVDALADDATIYSTNICSGTSRWEDADVLVREYGAYRAPKGALAMNDPPPFDDARLPPNLRELPQVCRDIPMELTLIPLGAPPPESALLLKLAAQNSEYEKVMSSVGSPVRDRWWRSAETQALGLCRTTREDPRACGALFASFEKIGTNPAVWKVHDLIGKACAPQK